MEGGRRKSNRIIALEEKRQQERERKLALALAKKNNVVNCDNRNNEKGKAIMDAEDESMDESNEEIENGVPTNRSSKIKELLISLSKELRKHSENADTSRITASSFDNIQLKRILELILDFQQRNDQDMLFAEPVDPNVVENYYEIIKQPMDFGTMKAKLNDGMYANLEQFKRDMCLICSNAMNAYPPNSKHYKVAEDISGYNKRIFEYLRGGPEYLEVEISLNKKRTSKKPQKGKSRTPKLSRLSPKLAGTRLASPETNKRDMYWPSNKSLITEFQYDDKPEIQLNINPSNYQDSVLRFVEGLGPVAQSVASRKLEALKSQQVRNDETPTQNLLENVPNTEMNAHQPSPQTPIEPNLFDAQTLALALPFFNRPLNISGSTTQENRNINSMNNTGNGNIMDGGSLQGSKKSFTNDNWHACAAALLSNFFFNNDKGGASANGVESSNARGKDKMGSPSENISSLLGLVQEDNHTMRNKNGNTEQWNAYGSMPNSLVPGSSSNVMVRVHPTRVISGHEPKQPNYMLPGNKPFIPQPNPQNTMPSINHSEFWPEDLIYGIPSNNLTEPSLMQYQQRLVSPLSQPNQGGPTFNRNNLAGITMMPSQVASFSNEPIPNTYLHASSIPYQPGSNIHAMLGSQEFKNSMFPMQNSHDQQVLHQASPHTAPITHNFPTMQMQVMGQLNYPRGPAPLQVPNSSSNLGMVIGGGMNYNGSGGVLLGQPEQATPPILWSNGQQPKPNLSLQL